MQAKNAIRLTFLHFTPHLRKLRKILKKFDFFSILPLYFAARPGMLARPPKSVYDRSCFMEVHMKNKLILLLVAFAALLINCGVPMEGARREVESGMDDYFMWMLFMSPRTYTYQPGPGNTITVTDRMDGSVEIVRSYSYYSSASPNYRTRVAKCPQGFTYDNTSYRCVAAGETALFQYCSVNSNACNNSDGTLNDLGTSEAYNTCKNSTTLALSWQVIKDNVLTDILRHPNRDTVFPTLADNWYWANNTMSTTGGYVYRRADLKESRSKTERHGVLCQYSGSYF